MLNVKHPKVNRYLWALVLLGAFGDIVTTYYGLNIGLAESNQVAEGVMSLYGFASLIVLKALVISVSYIVWTKLPEEKRFAIPTGLAVVWVPVTAWNLTLIFSVTQGTVLSL